MITEQRIQVCEICNEGITDPVCLNCYNRELIAWLMENIKNREIIKYIIKRAVRTAIYDYLGKDYCILCKREGVFICRHCYFSNIKRNI